MGRPYLRIAAALLVVCFWALAGQARATGTDLDNQTQFGNYTCAQVDVAGTLLPSEFTWGIIGPPRPINGCTYLALGAAAIGAPPGGGFAVAARVRIPTTSTGPMRVDVLRATRSDFGAQCCTLAATSTAFVPPPNATTQIPLALPMRNDLNVAFGETVDYLALTVLARDVVVPLAPVAGGTLASVAAGTTGSLAFHPELIASDAGSLSTGVSALPLINADVVPCAGTNQCTGLALTAARRVPTLVRLASGAVLPARCAIAGPGRCVVVATVPLSVARALGLARVASARRTTIGTGKVTFTAAGRRTARIKFTRKFRRAIASRRRSLAIRLEATATVSSPIPSKSQTRLTVKLRPGTH